LNQEALPVEEGGLCLITIGLDAEALETVKQVAAQEGVRFVTAFPDYPVGQLNAQLTPSLQAAEAVLCLIDFDKSKESAAQTATLARRVNGSTILVALSADESPDLILQAMRAGCGEYLGKPLQAERLASSLRGLCARWLSNGARPVQLPGRILAFLGVRGGAGATTLAVHLGTFLARRHAQKTLIIDLHPHLGHVALLLGMDAHRHNFHELLHNLARLDGTLLNSYVARHSSGVDVLLSPESLSDNNPISADAQSRAIRFCADVYDQVLIDCAGGWNRVNQTTISCCNDLFLVATPEVPALRDLARYMDRLLESEVPPAMISVVINQYDSRRTVTIDDIERAIRHPVAFTVPTSTAELMHAVDTGEPLSPDKKSEFASQVRKWASSLAPEPPPQNETKRRFGLLGLALSG